MENDAAGRRLNALEKLYTSPHSGNGQREKFSTETLLDILIVLFDECNTTVMKRDKRVLDFLEVGMSFSSAFISNFFLFLIVCLSNILILHVKNCTLPVFFNLKHRSDMFSMKFLLCSY